MGERHRGILIFLPCKTLPLVIFCHQHHCVFPEQRVFVELWVTAVRDQLTIVVINRYVIFLSPYIGLHCID